MSPIRLLKRPRPAYRARFPIEAPAFFQAQQEVLTSPHPGGPIYHNYPDAAWGKGAAAHPHVALGSRADLIARYRVEPVQLADKTNHEPNDVSHEDVGGDAVQAPSLVGPLRMTPCQSRYAEESGH